MDIRELRIGNWVLGDYSRVLVSVYKPMRITSIGIDKVNGWNEYSRSKPIPLTEELLLGCGFTKTTLDCSDVAYIKGGISLYRAVGIWYFSVGSYEHAIEYLHQLQNLFFCLSGKELEVKI